MVAKLPCMFMSSALLHGLIFLWYTSSSSFLFLILQLKLILIGVVVVFIIIILSMSEHTCIHVCGCVDVRICVSVRVARFIPSAATIHVTCHRGLCCDVTRHDIFERR